MVTTLEFLGAAGTVTGSRFLLRAGAREVLVDCGLFQGTRQLRERNWAEFPVDPAGIDAVVVSHAHLDHSGYLPALARDGFVGPVFASKDTATLSRVVLLDSAHLQEEDAEHAEKHGYSRHSPPKPLYTTRDAEHVLTQFRPLGFEEPVPIAEGMTASLRTAGHILGASSVTIAIEKPAVTVTFSGDLGRRRHPVLAPPAPPREADVMVVESTYGNRRHPAGTEIFAAALRRTLGRGGSVVIPAFAVDRTEVVLMELKRLMGARQVPKVPVYVDSPMALAALDTYRAAVRDHDPAVRRDLDPADDLFDPGELHEVRSVTESKELNEPHDPCIILSASGMATGGRVLHHLAGMLPDPRNTVVLAGFQAAGTRGHSLLTGAEVLKIHGRYVPVRAEVVDVQAFSVHADGDEIIQWLASVRRAPSVCYVVHGEPDASRCLADRITAELGWTAVVPALGERVRLD